MVGFGTRRDKLAEEYTHEESSGYGMGQDPNLPGDLADWHRRYQEYREKEGGMKAFNEWAQDYVQQLYTGYDLEGKEVPQSLRALQLTDFLAGGLINKGIQAGTKGVRGATLAPTGKTTSITEQVAPDPSVWQTPGFNPDASKPTVPMSQQAHNYVEGEEALYYELPEKLQGVTDRDEAFAILADMQRGRPETSMLRVQKTMGGGVVSFVAEHAGDLMHRMGEFGPKNDFGYEFVSDKVRKIDRVLNNEYGFEREFKENILSNADYEGVNPEAYMSKVAVALDDFAEAHARMPAYNDLQHLFRRLNVAIGKQDWKAAGKLSKSLREIVEDKDTYVDMAQQFDPEFQRLAEGHLLSSGRRIMGPDYPRRGVGPGEILKEPTKVNWKTGEKDAITETYQTRPEAAERFGLRELYQRDFPHVQDRHIDVALPGIERTMDLLGLPKEAFGLEGSKLVTGMTKPGVGGSFYPGANLMITTPGDQRHALVHEWAHAFDSYLGTKFFPPRYEGEKIVSKNISGTRLDREVAPKYASESGGHYHQTEIMFNLLNQAAFDSKTYGRLGNDLVENFSSPTPNKDGWAGLESIDAIMTAVESDPNKYRNVLLKEMGRVSRETGLYAYGNNPSQQTGMRKALKEKFDNVMATIYTSPEFMRNSVVAELTDETMGKNANSIADSYYPNSKEMFARSFEAYLYVKNGGKDIPGVTAFSGKSTTRADYPTGDELDRVVRAFDGLFNEIKSRKKWDKDSQKVVTQLFGMAPVPTSEGVKGFAEPTTNQQNRKE